VHACRSAYRDFGTESNVCIVDQDEDTNMTLIPCTECGKSISSKAAVCPQCGAPVGVALRRREWRTQAELFGLPLVHVAIGGDLERGQLRGVAKGIVAIGDIAFGVIALGGVAFGGLALGGVSLGLVSLGGAAIGVLLGLGGLATGYVALGGLAIGYYAMGGLAIGAHALGGNFQDPEAMEFFRRYLGTAVDGARQGR
jgi:ribosomal protein L37E